MAMEYSGEATIIIHNAIYGRQEQAVSWFKVSDVRPEFGQPEVDIVFCRRGKLGRSHSTVRSAGNHRYLTIEAGGRVLYDSRTDVPCDMAVWEAVRARQAKLPG